MITASPIAPTGSVTYLKFYKNDTFRSTDAILCRNFAPLVRLAFQLLRRGIPCVVLGAEFATQLEKLVTDSNARDIRDLIDTLEVRREKEFTAAEKKGRLRLCQIVEEKFDCIIYLAKQETSISGLMWTLKSLFDDNKKDRLILSTVHKSKGLEWPRVFILDVDLIPSKYAKQAWELQQETNIRYVAVTRAKLDLIYIKSERWEDQLPEEDEAEPLLD